MKVWYVQMWGMSFWFKTCVTLAKYWQENSGWARASNYIIISWIHWHEMNNEGCHGNLNEVNTSWHPDCLTYWVNYHNIQVWLMRDYMRMGLPLTTDNADNLGSRCGLVSVYTYTYIWKHNHHFSATGRRPPENNNCNRNYHIC